MTPSGALTQSKIIDAGRLLIMQRGYSGFSYADIADAIEIRKASIHHHFPAKSDLAIAVVRQARESFAAEMASLRKASADAPTQLRAYLAYWARCISDGSAPFCVAGMLGAELSVLPPELAVEVRGHFEDLTVWLEYAFALGVKDKHLKLMGSPKTEAAIFMSLIYGAMLMSRTFEDPSRFKKITDEAINKILKTTL